MLKRPERESEETAGGPAARSDHSSGRTGSPQRERLLIAMRELTATQRYDAISVSDVVARAGVSRRAFYESFADKEECFGTTYEETAQRLLDLVATAIDGEFEAEDAVRVAVDALLDFFAREPGAASVCVVDVLATGTAGAESRGRTVEQLADLFEQPLLELRPDPGVAQMSAQALIGGIYELAYGPVLRGGAAELPSLTSVVTDGWSSEFGPY